MIKKLEELFMNVENYNVEELVDGLTRCIDECEEYQKLGDEEKFEGLKESIKGAVEKSADPVAAYSMLLDYRVVSVLGIVLSEDNWIMKEILNNKNLQTEDIEYLLIETPTNNLLKLRDAVVTEYLHYIDVLREEYDYEIAFYAHMLDTYKEFILKYLETDIFESTRMNICESAYLIKTILDYELFDVKDYVLNDIKEENIANIDQWFPIAEMAEMMGEEDFSQRIHQSIIDMYHKTELEEVRAEIALCIDVA